ncbi:hypothetical protein [Lactovum miscens]|uniref:hypothetical protein n=1 Tax=Lactovum miscens TaxID=190387 RepID=UPI002ED87E75
MVKETVYINSFQVIVFVILMYDVCLLAEMNVQVKSNVTRVGHSSSKTTTEIYSYVTPRFGG